MSGSVFLVLWLLGWWLFALMTIAHGFHEKKKGTVFILDNHLFVGIVFGFFWPISIPLLVIGFLTYKLADYLSELDIDFKVERKK